MQNSNVQDAEIILKSAYQHFNNRDIEATLSAMHADVDWPNGMEGGFEHGHEAVRNYWTRQWKMFDPHVDPVQFKLEEDGRINVTVHQVVHDIEGKLLVDQMIHHIYTIEGGLIKNMEIKNDD
ncbi:MAG: nuclear transport factor 2 family protein [Ginsengibacter sp.]